MTKIKKYIDQRIKDDPELEHLIELENERLKIAVMLTELRLDAGITQKELAERINKPQSTISRIETGEMNPSISLIIEIANGIGKKFVPTFI